MNDLEQHFKKAAEQIRMTSDEKSAMRFRIQQETASATPAPVSSATPSPYVWMFAPRSLAMLSVALLVIFSTGSAYASEGSLPGSPLYPVKTKIVEPLKVALASTVQAKAQANADIAQVRVQEAQTLAAKGALTPEAVKQISDNYNEHARAALALAAHIDTHNGEDDDVAVITTTMAEPVEPEAEHSDAAGDVVAVAPTAPVTFSARIQEASSEDTVDEATSSPSTMRIQRTMKAVPPVAIKATSTATTTARQSNSHDFVRTLRASLSAQAEILQQLNEEVHSDRGEKGDK
ncbi:hypothetical protein K2Q00_03445 [Patescibacteria group bacterium]|nr:hypothetical protein [Patescibacteria group bacterium]